MKIKNELVICILSERRRVLVSINLLNKSGMGGRVF
jgi:hypothetical protein